MATFSFVASGTGTTSTITLPGTPTAGDVAVIWNEANSAAAIPALVTPSGFTDLTFGGAGAFNTRLSIMAKILVGGETTVTGMDGDAAERWVAATFTPDTPISSFAWAGNINAATSGNPAAQNFDVDAVSPPILLLGMLYTSGTAVDPRTSSPALSEIAGPDTKLYAHYKIYGTADTPADHSYDMDDEGGANFVFGVYMTFTLAAAGKPTHFMHYQKMRRA